MKKLSILLLCIFSVALFAGEMAPNFTLTDADGKKHSLADFKGKVVVLEWTNYRCPFVVKHYNESVKNMQKLQEKYTKKGVVWLSICSSAPGNQGHMPSDKIKEAMKKLGAAPTAYLIDADGAVGKAYGAKTTPHMFVVSAKGAFLYKGAIDSIRSAKSADVAKAQNFVAETLDVVLGDKKGEVPASTKSYGCGVKYAKKK
ncbi:thioredoxin family protein [Candidatus Uabimicrobium sp. HlEnr_7]|uniref:thioredoxin family protein n=1 Tax=Candidatus Uabimicrobium helgolandensis TaxID=3095367 RepID=UPI003558C9C2